MGYYIRYIFDTERRPKLPELRALLAQIDAGYAIDAVQRTPEEDAVAPIGSVWADIKLGADVIGALELREIDDPGGDEEIQGLLEELEDYEDDAAAETASSALWNATGVLRVQVVWEGEDHSESLRKLNPLWQQLLARYGGILQADQEGYYDQTGQILEME